MRNFTITSHILDALDIYLEGYQSDHKRGVISDEEMQTHEEVYEMCLGFILDDLPQLQKELSK